MRFTSQSELDQHLVEEYFMRNRRRREDGNWLKENRLRVLEAMDKSGRDKEDFGEYRISVSTPNNSKFDEDKVLEYADKIGILDKIVKPSLDEAKLMNVIESNEIDLEELKKFAWVESTGSPRVSIKKMVKDED